MRQQHGPICNSINRALIEQRLLIKFSCELSTRYPILRDLLFVPLLVFVTSGCHNTVMILNQTTYQNSITITEIASSLEYKSNSEASTSFSPLPIYTSSLSTLPPPSSPFTPPPPSLTPSSIDSSSLYNMGQHKQVEQLQLLIRQQAEQIAVMQAQIVALAGGARG